MIAADPPYVGPLHPDYRPPVVHLRVPPMPAPPGDPPGSPERVAALRDRAGALQERWVRRARAHFPSFMEYVFFDWDLQRPFRQQWFHDEWDALMRDYPHVLIIAPRGHGKTTFVVGRCIWELGRNHNLRIKLGAASDGRAKERLLQVRQLIEHSPRVREVFPTLRPATDAPWNAHRLYLDRTAVLKDASLEAVGILSTVTGGRADLLVPDDVVDRRNALTMPALRRQVRESWLGDWSNVLDPRTGRVHGVCTLWHRDDLNHSLMHNPAYRVHFTAVTPDLGTLWTERWPLEALRTKRQLLGPVEFARGFFNRPSDDEGQIVHPEWIRFADLSVHPEFQARQAQLQYFCSYDPAGTPRANSRQDYTAGVVIAVDVAIPRVYVVDAWHARLSLHAASARVAADTQRFAPVFRVVVEHVGQSALHEEVLEHHPELRGYLETATPHVGKAERLQAVTPLLEQGQVLFSAHLNPNQPGWMPDRENLVHELEDFPLGAHDDLVDAFSQALYWARRYWLDRRARAGDTGTVEVHLQRPTPAATEYLF